MRQATSSRSIAGKSGSADHGWALGALAGWLILTACQKKVPEKIEETSASVATAAASAPAAPSASAAKAPRPPSQPGEWIESLRYRFRVLDVTPCEQPGPSGPFRLGVTVEVQATSEAKVSPVVASPAAATLEQGGKIFRAQMKPLPSETCSELLGVAQLEPGESAKGVLVFEAPNESYFRSAIFAFKPPRWGGELRTEVRLPDCFGANCPSASPAGSGSARAPRPASSRP